MISETFFTQTALHNNFLVGAPIRINKLSGRYAWHRIVKITQTKKQTTILTVSLDANFEDNIHRVWTDKELLDATQLITVADSEKLSFEIATWWEHDILPGIIELPFVHVN